jgi:alkylation response protein AidB-like acyl-CoA dehydrogenase
MKPKVFERFLNHANMGGLMITEPDFGSDALSMQTYNEKIGADYHIKGIKHWQGLTGIADYWLMTSRAKSESGRLARDIDFFITDEQIAAQRIEVEELYNNAGLYPIPYGKNIVDIIVPEENKLIPETTGLKLIMDLLHRSRYQFPGMAMGFIHRNLDECLKQCTTRIVAGHPLINMDQIQHMIGRVQSAFTICSAFAKRSAEASGIENDLAGSAVEANTIKAYVTDLMHESAQTLTQLYGAKGYIEESYGIRGVIDSRPYRIFEGSNEMLYTQISEIMVKSMVRGKNTNLVAYLKEFELTKVVADRYKDLLNFDVENKMPQRKLVDLGQIISRVLSAQMVVNLGDSGFRSDLVQDALSTIRHDITMLVSSYNYNNKVKPVVEYQESSSWLDFC